MKALIESLVFVVMTSFLYAQDLTGDWTGSLQIQGTTLKVVLHVSMIDGKYTTTFDSPDQNANGIKVTTTTYGQPVVTFEIPSVGAIYKGDISGNRITGKWLQSGTAFFLELVRK